MAEPSPLTLSTAGGSGGLTNSRLRVPREHGGQTRRQAGALVDGDRISPRFQPQRGYPRWGWTCATKNLDPCYSRLVSQNALGELTFQVAVNVMEEPQ